MDTIIIISLINIICFSLGFFFCFVALDYRKKKVSEQEVLYVNTDELDDEEAFVPEVFNDQ